MQEERRAGVILSAAKDLDSDARSFAALRMTPARQSFPRALSRRLAIPFVFCLLAIPAIAGSVKTVDGKTYDGDVRLEKGQVVVSVKRAGDPVRLNVDDVLAASFRMGEQTKGDA